MSEKQREWQKCRTCHFCVEMRSHPCVDKKPVTNCTGYACIVGIFMDNPGTIHSNWHPDSIQCELWTEKNTIKITYA